MTMTDPIADMLTRIRNAQMAEHKDVNIPHTRINSDILEILMKEGFFASFEKTEIENRPYFNVKLKYDKFGDPVIHKIEKISKPGLRKYIGYKDLRPVMGGMGLAILSTNKGIMTDKDARREKVGGEIICKIW